MLDSFAFSSIIGTALGFLAGLGVGGGSLLMLWLTLVLGFAYTTARTVNLLFFIPTAVISCFFRKNQGTLDLKRIFPSILFGVLSAAVFSLISKHFDIGQLKKLFGILLLITGVREILYRPRKAR